MAVVDTLQKQKNIAGALAFWMANASELLNFIKQDRDLNRITLDAQDILAHLVQMAFKSVCVWLCEWMWDVFLYLYFGLKKLRSKSVSRCPAAIE